MDRIIKRENREAKRGYVIRNFGIRKKYKKIARCFRKK